MPAIEELAASLEDGPGAERSEVAVQRIVGRLPQREPEPLVPVFVGLLHPSGQGGVFINSVPLTGYGDTDREALLDYLAANLYGGGGSHSIFMRTWGAGLAYSNGIGPRLSDGRIGCSMNTGLRALRSRRLLYFSTAAPFTSVPVSSSLIAASIAAGLRCM